MNDTFTVTITKEVSYNDLWEAIWGSDGSGITYWCSKIRKPDGSDIDLWIDGGEQHSLKPNPQDFKLYDAEEGQWHLVTLDNLADAYRKAFEIDAHHCGTYAVTNLEDADECAGDILLQLAVFGEIVYG
jgi:hypothetical protein